MALDRRDLLPGTLSCRKPEAIEKERFFKSNCYKRARIHAGEAHGLILVFPSPHHLGITDFLFVAMCQNYGILDGRCRLPERAGGELGIINVSRQLGSRISTVLEKKVCYCRSPSFLIRRGRVLGDLIILIRPGASSNELAGIPFFPSRKRVAMVVIYVQEEREGGEEGQTSRHVSRLLHISSGLESEKGSRTKNQERQEAGGRQKEKCNPSYRTVDVGFYASVYAGGQKFGGSEWGFGIEEHVSKCTFDVYGPASPDSRAWIWATAISWTKWNVDMLWMFAKALPGSGWVRGRSRDQRAMRKRAAGIGNVAVFQDHPRDKRETGLHHYQDQVFIRQQKAIDGVLGSPSYIIVEMNRWSVAQKSKCMFACLVQGEHLSGPLVALFCIPYHHLFFPGAAVNQMRACGKWAAAARPWSVWHSLFVILLLLSQMYPFCYPRGRGLVVGEADVVTGFKRPQLRDCDRILQAYVRRVGRHMHSTSLPSLPAALPPQ
ncbi:uncharacterized protein CLUP02_03374 [Colletotrichum lupini]|uniref:Uncharacterized protein n=1 Tax=Colletotrichum lupini TaxID=145971 RepID=A0A9Q8WCA2_9PEZI|nr:uncharacterized protein CLUP02_03374 [Colletotrichum lupini]UQC77901.1 hypothetical protein CLUP02_03374 [Colletotrichum lupini]